MASFCPRSEIYDYVIFTNLGHAIDWYCEKYLTKVFNPGLKSPRFNRCSFRCRTEIAWNRRIQLLSSQSWTLFVSFFDFCFCLYLVHWNNDPWIRHLRVPHEIRPSCVHRANVPSRCTFLLHQICSSHRWQSWRKCSPTRHNQPHILSASSNPKDLWAKNLMFILYQIWAGYMICRTMH